MHCMRQQAVTEVVGLYYLISAAFSIESSIISNFILNDRWTFGDRPQNGGGGMLARGLKFNLVSLAGVAINMVILWSATTFGNIYYLVSNLLGIVVATAWNFFVNIAWTWREPK